MKVNEHDFKDLVNNMGEFNVKLGVIQEKCTYMEAHLKEQNGRVFDHDKAINKLCVSQEALKTKFWAVMILASLASGAIGSIITYIITNGFLKGVGV